jgi:hypothetical protein
MSKFNGHKNWNHWNVSLWLNNDEGLYNLMRDKVRNMKRFGGTKDDAAEALRVLLSDLGQTHTPDGAPYSKSSIRAAMVGLT